MLRPRGEAVTSLHANNITIADAASGVGWEVVATYGAVSSASSHIWATHGRRDFASTRSLAAAQYDVVAAEGHAAQARALIAG
jgi:hypothetical protein